jgi:ABC-type branched-subunit amino acid transport system substrate-binding protein
VRCMLGGTRRLLSAAALGLAMLALVACGRDDGGSAGGGKDGGSLATAPGFDGKRFKLGLITVTSGPVAGANAPSLSGIQTYVKALNAKGGIAGKYPVDLVLRDMQYDPAKTVQAYNSTKNDVALYAQVFGTPMTKAILPQLRQDKIIAVPGSFDGSFVREQNIMLASTPYETQMVNGIDYVVRKHGKGKVCGAGGEGALAETVKNGLKYVKAKMGLETGPTVSLPTAATNLTPQVQQLRREGCKIIWMIATPVPTVANTLSASARLKFDAQWVSTNTGFVSAMKDSPVFDYMKTHYQQSSDGTLFGDTDNAPGMQALTDAHEKYAKDTLPEWAYTNGWTGMMQVDQVLAKAVEMGDVSRDGIIEAMNSITEFDLGGIQFSPAWGAPDARKPPSKYGIFVPDESSKIGIKAAEYGLDAPAAATDYPYENAKE